MTEAHIRIFGNDLKKPEKTFIISHELEHDGRDITFKDLHIVHIHHEEKGPVIVTENGQWESIPPGEVVVYQRDNKSIEITHYPV